MKKGCFVFMKTDNITYADFSKDNIKTYNKNHDIKQNSKEISDTVYAGDVRLFEDEINQKKTKSAKEAIKTILNQFAKDMEYDESVKLIKEKRDEILELIPQYQEDIKNANSSLEKLKEEFDITPDSEEMKELEIRRKLQNHEMLTKEEEQKLQSMGEITDFQKNALEYYKRIDFDNTQIERINDAVKNINSSLDAMSIERLKSNPMLEAQNKAKDILLEGANEIKQMAFEEAVDNIDKAQEENEEKVEEKSEKKSEEKTEKKIEEKKEEAEEIYKKAMRDIQKIADKNSLTKEDIKGLMADIRL